MSGLPPVQVTLRVARDAAQRQAALDAWLASAPAPRAVVVEGALAALAAPDDVEIVRLAAGCPCCLGLVPLRVALARLLRARRPRALLLLVAGDAHLPRLHAMLASGELGALAVNTADGGPAI